MICECCGRDEDGKHRMVLVKLESSLIISDNSDSTHMILCMHCYGFLEDFLKEFNIRELHLDHWRYFVKIYYPDCKEKVVFT